MCMIWAMLIMQLSVTWQVSEQYSHGFLIPLLSFYLLLKSPSNKIMENKTSFLQGKAWIFLGIPLMISLIPIWIITSANSDWRLVNVVLFGIVFLLTLIPFYDHGGWINIKYKIFPFYSLLWQFHGLSLQIFN